MVADRDNIRQTLPFLQDEQQDDVHKAESRFGQGHGMLFTNGTGTGKTYTGLGVIKRFAKQGKHNILIVAPSQDIINDWVRSGANLGLTINVLESTLDAGEGICITTYANLGSNRHLADRDWDLVVSDESHKLMTNEAGEPTEALNNFRAITNHPGGLYTRADMILRDLLDSISEMRGEIGVLEKSDDDRDRGKARALNAVLQAKIAEYNSRRKELAEAYASRERSKVVMLSATPFAYVKNVDYAEGYLFEYAQDNGSAYNSGDGREKFFMQHFGYRMRYNKLTQPDANVNGEVMERGFNEYLKQSGALSGRRLSIDQDYERSFALVDDAIGAKIDEGLEWLRTAKGGRYGRIHDAIRKKFDYLSRMRLLEALKARHAVGIIRKQLALGRKVVVFHDYNEGGALENPFRSLSVDPLEEMTLPDGSTMRVQSLLDEAKAERPDIFTLDIEGIASPINTIQAAFPKALIYNGTIPNRQRTEAKRLFNDDDSGHDIIVVQSAAGEAGISLHDTTGKHPRILLNLGMPTRPTTAIQQEGRIYRVGQKTNAVFKYLNTGTTWERQTFASKISERASTVENLALGDEARALRQAFIDAYTESDYYEPSESEGTGGKEKDKAQTTQVSPFERAKSYYYAQAKNAKSRANREGKDYYATPEPVGFKLVEFGNVRSGDKLLEPSAGHGAIARFFPEGNARTLIEASADLSSRAALASPGSKVITGDFESLHITNKYDVIAMNPPYGTAGKLAIEHVAKAAAHLRNGGRIVALIPEGRANDRLSEFLDSEAGKDIYPVADIHLPAVTFERAGTAVMTHIVVLEKQTDKENAEKLAGRSRNIDLTNAETIGELFDRLEAITVPPRLEPLTKEVELLLKDERVTVGGITFRSESDSGRVLSLDSRISREQYGYLARMTDRFNGLMYKHGYKTVYDFKTPEEMRQFLDAVDKNEPTSPAMPAATQPAQPGQAASPETVAQTGKGIMVPAEFKHTQNGNTIFVSRIAVRLDDAAYRQAKMLAGKYDGYYSSFSRGGAIPGFHFKTREDRDRFVAEMNGTTATAGFDSMLAGSLTDILRRIMALSEASPFEDVEQLAGSIGVSVSRPGFALAAQTEEERRAKEAADQAAQAKADQERIAAERKAQADRDAADFKLTGSDRPADVAMAAGQGDLFAPKTRGQKEAEKQQEAASTAKPAPAATDATGDGKDIIVDDELLEIAKTDTKAVNHDIGYALRMDQQGVMPGKPTYLNDFIKRGKLSIDDVSAGWEKTRAYIRRKYGNVVGLYRADAPKSEHHPDTTILFMGDKKLAARFAIDGRKLERFRVKVDDIVGLNATASGYYEFLVKKPGIAKADDGDDMDPNSPNYRYRDTGYIADSRKEKAQDQIRAARAAGQLVGFQMIDWAAIEQNPRAAKEMITKSNLFGKVDWEALKAAGMTPEAGFLIDRIYASIGTEPGTDGPMGRKDYAIGIQSIRDRMEKCRTASDVLAVLAEIRDEFQGTILNAEETAQIKALQDQAAVVRKRIVALEAERKVLKDAVYAATNALHELQRAQDSRIRRGWKPDPEIDAKVGPAEEDYKAAEKALKEWDDAHPEIVDTFTTVKTANGGMHGTLINPLKDEYRSYYQRISDIESQAKKRNILENQATRSWVSFGPKFFSVLNYRSASKGSEAFAGHVVNALNNRVGGWDWAEKERAKPVKQATKEEVRFQLRVVENYQRVGGRPVSAKSTQELKDTFGFRDVQSGNWVLKDPASARFHVEQTAGAMDDMGDILGISPSVLGLGGRLAMAFGARGSGAKGWKDSAPRAHYEPVHRVINLTKMGGGGCLGHEYFHALDNMLGELVSQKVSDNKGDMVTLTPELLPPGRIRSAVSELKGAMLSGNRRLPETFRITPRDRALAKANLERQYLGSFQQSIRDAGSAEAAVLVVRSKYMGTDNKRMLKQRDAWTQIAVAYFTPEDKDRVTLETGPYGSDFLRGAVELDAGEMGKYWSTPEEMAARAFQAYLEDRMADAGRRNDYLSALADNKHYVDPLLGIEWKPYPEGEERTRINDSFDRFFAEMRAGRVLEQAVENKALMDAMFPGFDALALLDEIEAMGEY